MFALKIAVLFSILQLGKNDLPCLNIENSGLLGELLNVPTAIVSEFAQKYICANATATLGPVLFLLYLPSNQTVTVDANNASQYMNFSNPTKIIIHGWKQNGREPWIVDMAWLLHQKRNCNVIAVDWSGDSCRSYPDSTSVVPLVGYRTAAFLISLTKYLASFLQNCHIIGHSLGAHIAGFAGKRITEITGELVWNITGLDPAGPLFSTPFKRAPECRLSATDASYVDVLHVDICIFGVTGSGYGDQDIFINYGFIQPSCVDPATEAALLISDFKTQALINISQLSQPSCLSTALEATLIICDHLVVTKYYIATIPDPLKYEAVACENAEKFALGLCNNNARTLMGYGDTFNVNGTFYINIDKNGNTNNP